MIPVAKDDARKLFIAGLRDAHAMEKQAQTMMERQVERLRHYPDVERRMRAHLQETATQMSRLEEILKSLGEERSAFKDMALTFAGNMSSLMNAMADDEVLKNSLVNYAFEAFEIASYESLITLGEAAGETEAIRLLQQSLSEERAMAGWLADNLRAVTLMHLQLRTEKADASR